MLYTGLWRMSLLEYIKKLNADWDELTPFEQVALSLKFAGKYLIHLTFYEKIDGQNWRQN